MSYKTKELDSKGTSKFLDQSWEAFEQVNRMGKYSELYPVFFNMFQALDSMDKRIKQLEERPIRRFLGGSNI